jgi:O-antigen ligase/tetratricopeptide (TPR) repeat protein
MMILRVFQTLTLWALVFAVWAHAWMTSVAATTYDARVPWGAGVCLAAWAAAQLVVWAGSRWAGPLHRLDTTRHGLALLFAALAAAAMSHVGPHMSIRVMREEVPPIFLWAFPSFVAWVPIWLSASARKRSAADQLLLLTVFATAMSGALMFLQPAVAVGLGLLALTMQLVDTQQRAPNDALVWVGAILVALFAVATLSGINRLDAIPSLRWITASSLLGLAIAWRRRDERGWRDILGASASAAVLVALCGILLTAFLAREVALEPALRSRLVLFRQHPNFLAPFFGFHAVLAVALASRRRTGSILWLLAAALLVASTWMTDSRTGIAATVIALLLLPGLPMLAALQRRIRLRWVFGLALVLLVAGAFGVRELHQQGRLTSLTSRVTRMQESMSFRGDAWTNSVAIVRESPWAGIGPQSFLSVVDFQPESRFFNAAQSPHPHDVFLYVAQSAGIPALLMFLLWIGVLVRRLWRRVTGPPEEVPRALLVGVLASVVGLLLANLLDLGLSLQTVVPAPLFLITGLVVSDRLPRRRTGGRPARELIWSGALAWVFIGMAYQPIRAETHVVQGELLAYDAGQSGDQVDLMDRARDSLKAALHADPTVPRAHRILARWCEDLPDGFNDARDVLQRLIDLAPENAGGHALLAQLFMRNQMYAAAAEEFRLALDDRQGSPQRLKHRAEMILCVARSGDREGALELFVESLRLNAGVHHQIAWMNPPAPPQVLQVGLDPYGEDAQPFISLIEALEILYARLIGDREAGRPVGRTIWMDLFRAFREAGQDERASQMLDDLEANAPEVEAFTIAAARGEIAFDAGDVARAAEFFDLAYELSGHRPFYLLRASEARRAMGETVAAVQQSEDALSAWWEILDLPDAFRDFQRKESQNLLDAGDPVAAAEMLQRSLLFEDDLLERVRLRLHVAELFLQGRDVAACERTVRNALAELDAKPFPWTMLIDGHQQSLPGRIARVLSDAWRAEGLDAAERLQRGWSLPAFFSSRAGATLFRLSFYLENGLASRLLREADLALLADPGHRPALWARLFALEGLGRHAELGPAMRTLVEVYAQVSSPERQFQNLVDIYTARPEIMKESHAWRELGMLDLLRGAYPEAIGAFKEARDRVEGDPRKASDLASWQALSAWLAGRPEEAAEALREALRLDPTSDMIRRRSQAITP